jgi:regulator of protease activity HflC (stomatin/prohibitin superfamily)
MLSFALTIVGLLVMVAGIAGYFVPKVFAAKRNSEAMQAWRYNGSNGTPPTPEKAGLPMYAGLALLALGLCLMFGNGAFYYAEPGYNYLVQYPTGTQLGETAPGYHLKWWGTAEPFKKFITVKADNDPTNDTAVSASIPPIEGRFTDAVTAQIEVTARFQLPAVEKDFLNLALAFRTQENLSNSTLIPVLKEVVRNSARTMTAQDYIAGKGGEFENSILDQLREGTYILEIEEIKRDNGKDNITDEGDRGIDNSQMVKYEVNKKTDDSGMIVRKPTALHDYHIIVAQANISNVDPEKKFKEMLGLQRDAAAQASVKKQEAKRAEYDKQKIIAEGETEKASIRIQQEKAQINKLIAAETMLKEAEIDLKQAKIQKAKEIEVAAKVKIAADAEAYAKRKVLAADGALDKKLAAFNAAVKDISKGWANRPVPQVVINSGGSGDPSSDGYSGSPEEVKVMLGMMLADMAKNQLSTNLDIPKGAK